MSDTDTRMVRAAHTAETVIVYQAYSPQIGDAHGVGIEFRPLTEIRRRNGPCGVASSAPAYGRTGTIIDATQMTLFTAEGLLHDQSAAVREPRRTCGDSRMAIRRRRAGRR